jgi:hypothetical protein
MGFPVLTAHQVYPYFFQLGGRLSPISIRDQMVRAEAIVEQAFRANLIGGSTNRPLLVVGAGAAGATAGITAARSGVPTLIVDHGFVPFRLQAACATRWIDPTQYDGPSIITGLVTIRGCPLHRRLPWAGRATGRINSR